MSFYQKNSRWLITAAMVMAAAGVLAFFCRLAVSRPDIYFLEQHAPAQWVLYPKPPLGVLLKDPEISTTFRRPFVLINSPASARLSLRAFTRWELSINGAFVAASTPGKNWKLATDLDVTRQLRPGTNEILVTVFNSNGPPVLWLSLDAGETHIASDATWDVSLMDAVTQKAVIAGAPVQFGRGSRLDSAERPLPSLFKHSLAFCILTIFSGALVVRGSAWLKGYRERGEPYGPLVSAKFAAVAIGILALLWAALFLNNHHLLIPRLGYDSGEHIKYIEFIRTHWRIPFADEGWQMYQPPLYYLLCAFLLLPFNSATLTPAAFATLWLFNYCIGVVHVIIVFLCLRVLFPGRVGVQWFGLLLAAFLFETMGFSHFISNESLAATLFSAAVYFCLRILKEDGNSNRLFLAFGLCLGASLLTKFTGVVGVPVFAAALLSRSIPISALGHGGRGEAADQISTNTFSRIRLSKILFAFAIAFAVCGWHYIRVWRRFGHPLVGNWDPCIGYSWWMEEGYHIGSWFFHFGACFVYPWFSGFNGFADGLYSTFWGDANWAGIVDPVGRPPWNYELMAAGYLLALLPTFLILAGVTIALRRFLRRPDAAWFLLLGVAFATLAALLYMCLKLPSYGQVKAFYGLIALVPICAFAALGWELILRCRRAVVLTAATVMGVWAINSYASFWVRSSNPKVHLALGNFYTANGNPAAALQQYVEAVRVGPREPEATTRLAVALASQNPAETERLLRLTLKEFPDGADTHFAMSTLLGSQKKFEEGIAEARTAVALAPDQPAIYPTLCKMLMAGGHFREAAETGRDGLRVIPCDADLQELTGTAFLRAGDQTNAAAHFAHAVSLKPDWPEARDEFGTLLLVMRQEKAALGQLSEAVKLEPDDAAFHYHLALAQAGNGKTSDAIDECRRALQLDPGLAGASQSLKSFEAGNK